MIPAKLRPGDTIAVFSPSSPATATAAARYRRGKEYLEAKGFRCLEGSLTGRRDFYRSGTIRERAEEFNALVRDPNVRCIMAAIGGNNSNSLLPYLEYEGLCKDPKIIVGYSDVTALLLGIYAQTGLTTYYGPAVVASFGEFPPFVDETYTYFTDIVTERLTLPHTLPTPPQWTDEFIDWNSQDKAKKGRVNALLTLLVFAAMGVMSALILRAEPNISGSGIPQISAELSGRLNQRWQRVLPLKFLGGLLSLGGGLTLGREGPSVQVGGSVGAAVAQLLHRPQRPPPAAKPRRR